MNLKVLISSFILIFLAEMADKTQLAAVTLSAKEKTPVAIFIGAVLGFALSTFLAVIVGTYGSKLFPTELIQKVSALAFIIIGILLFFNIE